ncbi:unnamed protein product [Anisakis simplex]|uniref:A-kinase anchor protein 17A (inferred by orthology to a human protein) n=1 Tax=Anisakis simplex TaxID=6269 RepID=A0A0M3KGG9_ANISI|nr:unnamed protein product [Anisakis simplex]
MNESENDLEPFYEPLGLYIRPCARLNISLTLPPLKQPGQSISNWDLMEKIKKAIVPVQLVQWAIRIHLLSLQLSSIRVTLSTMEMVRFEAELPNRKMLHKVDILMQSEESEKDELDTSKKDSVLPSEKLLKETFEQFGRVRCVDIPSCDPYRKQMPSSISDVSIPNGRVEFEHLQEIYFEAYVQFMEYISFMRAMNALRNMNLVKKMPDGRLCEASIKVT